MPAIAAISINDGAATPVAHSFSVQSTNGAKAEWKERTSGAPAGFYTISHEVVNPSSPTAAYRIKIGFSLPVTETVNGVPTVTRMNSAQVVLNFAQSSTEQERKDAVAFVINFMSNANVKSSAHAIEPFY
jgi:hypothetical protein